MGQLQERITSTKKGSITSVQAIYVPADDITDPRRRRYSHISTPPPCCPANLRARHLSAVDPLSSTRRILDPNIIGAEHYATARAVQSILQRYKDLQRHHPRSSAMEELSDEDKVTVARARKIQRFLSQPMFVRRAVHRPAGRYVRSLTR